MEGWILKRQNVIKLRNRNATFVSIHFIANDVPRERGFKASTPMDDTLFAMKWNEK